VNPGLRKLQCFWHGRDAREAMTEANLSKVKGQIPLNRLGEVEHVYQAVRFIIENDYVNGTVVEVDGGLVM
jgi:3-oxoacyl-[acyl-carrier protein] reductase